MMDTKVLLACFVAVFLLVNAADVYVTNLNETCLRCLCHVAGCDLSRGCTEGYCGPYKISHVYWVDADKPTLAEDTPEREESFQDCARNYVCAQRIVTGYLAKYGKDCNGDGITDCFDYVMINYNGGWACSTPLNSSALGREKLKSYQECRLY